MVGQQAPRVPKALGENEAAFVYNLATARAVAQALRGLTAVARVHYSTNANPHPRLLATCCAEVERALSAPTHTSFDS
jgi:hypothetical protein